jgi:hypothetical protein
MGTIATNVAMAVLPWPQDVTSLALQCLNAGCNPVNVGNGICDPACNVTACYNDGGDCRVLPHLKCPSDTPYQECSGKGFCANTAPYDDDGSGPAPSDFVCLCTCGASGGSDCSMCPTSHSTCPAPSDLDDDDPSEFPTGIARRVFATPTVDPSPAPVEPSPAPVEPSSFPWPSSWPIPSFLVTPSPGSSPQPPGFWCPQYEITFPLLPSILQPLSNAAALASDRVSGAAFYTPPLTVNAPHADGSSLFAYSTCSGQQGLSFTPQFGLSVWSPTKQEILAFIGSTLFWIESCRATSVSNNDSSVVPPLTSSQFITRFEAWQPGMFLFQHSTSGAQAAATPGFDFGNDLSDWLAVRPETLGWNTTERYDFPATCNYSGFVQRIPQPCRLAFQGQQLTPEGPMDGLDALLLSQGSLFADVQRCTGAYADGMPAVGLSYKGQLQSMLTSLTTCASNADCAPGLICAVRMRVVWCASYCHLTLASWVTGHPRRRLFQFPFVIGWMESGPVRSVHVWARRF